MDAGGKAALPPGAPPPRLPAAGREAALPPGHPPPATRRPGGKAALPPGPPHFATRRPGGRRPFPPDTPTPQQCGPSTPPPNSRWEGALELRRSPKLWAFPKIL